jgi:GT2 family glycosyltransferase
MILNWNGARWLEPLLDSIVRQTCNDYEVILIDNASSDSSLELARGYPWVRIAAFRQNLGYAPAYNLACTLARGEYLLLLNNDTVLAPDFVQEIAETCKDPQARLIAPMVTSYDGSGAGACGLNVDLMGYPGHDQSRCSFYVDGCALVIEAALFRALRGFDG